jgi:hypothetical protein
MSGGGEDRAPAGRGGAEALRAPGHRGSVRGGPVKGIGGSARHEEVRVAGNCTDEAHRRRRSGSSRGKAAAVVRA